MMKINNIKTGKDLKEFRESLPNKPQEKFARIVGRSLGRINQIEVKDLPISDGIRKAIRDNIEKLKREDNSDDLD